MLGDVDCLNSVLKVGVSYGRLVSKHLRMPLPLSAKAQGKQRAVDPPLEDEPLSQRLRELVVRFTEGIPDLTVQVGEKDSVRAVKKTVS